MYQAESYKKICDFIDTLVPCMDDYLYAYNKTKDEYHISSTAYERFQMCSHHFHNVAEEHKKFVYSEDYDLLIANLNQIFDHVIDFHNMQYRWITRNGDTVWINCRGKVIYSDSDEQILIGCINGIGDIQKADNISGLLGMSSLQSLYFDQSNFFNDGYFIQIGLDDFKEINEKLGNDYGNLIIKKTADCIRSNLCEEQQLFRLSGDEFLLLDLNGNSVSFAKEQYKKIRSSIDEFVAANHYESVFTISAGILPFHSDVHYSFSDIMKFSDFSLNEAKRRGKNQAYIFSQEDYDHFVRRRNITSALRQSINHDFEGFEIYLQPLYNISMGKIFGAEQLLRFHSDTLGNISPAEFIPLLEDTGLIVPVGKWVLHKSLALCEEMSRVNPTFRIAINVSYKQILMSNIISEIIHAVDQYHISPDQLHVELTESGYLDSDIRVSKMWANLKEKGIHLALDDFGTGYSNFRYINDIRPDLIKIDRSLTVNAIENDYVFHMISLMSNMVHSMDCLVCIEGIENEEELQKMSELKPDIFQGYFFGRPCPYEEFKEKYLYPSM